MPRAADHRHDGAACEGRDGSAGACALRDARRRHPSGHRRARRPSRRPPHRRPVRRHRGARRGRPTTARDRLRPRPPPARRAGRSATQSRAERSVGERDGQREVDRPQLDAAFRRPRAACHSGLNDASGANTARSGSVDDVAEQRHGRDQPFVADPAQRVLGIDRAPRRARGPAAGRREPAAPNGPSQDRGDGSRGGAARRVHLVARDAATPTAARAQVRSRQAS